MPYTKVRIRSRDLLQRAEIYNWINTFSFKEAGLYKTGNLGTSDTLQFLSCHYCRNGTQAC